MKFKAFSLIELMVVIAIVAVLSAVAIPSYKSYLIRSKVAADMTLIYNLTDQVKQYYVVNGTNSLPLFPPYTNGFGPTDTMLGVDFIFTNYGIRTKALDSFRAWRDTRGFTNFEFSVSQTLMPASPNAKVIFVSTGCNRTSCVTYCGWYFTTEEQRSVALEYLPSSCQMLGIEAAIEDFVTR